jgi:hypothetical protein
MRHKIQTEPTLKMVLDAFKEDIFATLNCHAVGIIESFDKDLQTASVSFAYSSFSVNDIFIPDKDYPKLEDVPVVVLGGGRGSLRFPIEKGDSCLLLFNDRDIASWLTVGSTKPKLTSDRKHDLSDCFAIVGLRSSAEVIKDYDADRTELVHDKTIISMKDRIRIKNDFASLFTILNLLMDSITPTTGITPELKEAIKLQLALLMET